MGAAALLRFWQLGVWPPGLYRDEAFNGLDVLALSDGRHPLFFTANNGREPAYIYLASLSVAFLGRSVLALRLPAAIMGTLTTLLVYLLAHAWFGRRAGLFAAWLWAITLWPVHLSHIGLRVILLVPCLALTFWLGTLAYRRQQQRLWLLAGLAYGLCFYTYLAVRFTPLLLGLLFLYLLWRRGWRRLWPGTAWFALGAVAILLPLALFYARQPELLLGRTGQVSIFNPAVHHGDLWGTLARQIGRALGLFFWRGDTILRHNPAGRPLFDPFMALPFLVGLAWCLRQWRRPPAAAALLWVGAMLGATVLAEDAPHFLRAVGVLPAALFLPAIGLGRLWQWDIVPALARRLLVVGILAVTLLLTVRDYAAYGRNPETALLFEAAATELAAQLQAEEGDTAVYLDRWFWDEATQKGWPSIPFLANLQNVHFYRPELGLPPAAPGQAVSIYAWPFGDLNFVPQHMAPPALVVVQPGALARGDLEATAYPLYIRYHARPLPTGWPEAVNFDNQLWLWQAAAAMPEEQMVWVDLFWQAETAVPPTLTAFVQLIDAEEVVAQSDLPPGSHAWQAAWWQPGLVVHERRTMAVSRPIDAGRRLIVGLYDQASGARLPVLDEDGRIVRDYWEIEIEREG